MTTALEDEIIRDFENRVNEKINTLYDVFYIQPYRQGARYKYGVNFNGYIIARCRRLEELEEIINTIMFFLEGGITKRW